MVVRRRLTGTGAPKIARPQKQKLKKWWLSNTTVKPETARLGEAIIILGKVLRFNRIIVDDAGKKAPPVIHFSQGEQRALCVNTGSEKFELNESMNNQSFAVAELLRQSVTVFSEKFYSAAYMQLKKKSSYNFVFDLKSGLFAVAEQAVDHDRIAESFEALNRFKVLPEGSAADHLKGEFKMHPDLGLSLIAQLGLARSQVSEAGINKLRDAIKGLNVAPELTWYSTEGHPS